MFHLHIRYLSRDGGGSCESARQYAVREGRFRKRGDVVRLVRSLHMPEWVRGDSARNYWVAAEGRGARVNARTAVLIEFALPHDLDRRAQDELALEMGYLVSTLCVPVGSGAKMPVTLAIHEGCGRNPHVHMLLSTSANDTVERPADRWFRRYSAKSPSSGGAPRPRVLTKRRWVHRVRELWASLANAALQRAGVSRNVDHRSNRHRGLAVAPSLHLGPRITHLMRHGVDTPRANRNRSIADENRKALEQEADIARRRRELWALELEVQVLSVARGVWNAYRESEWRHVLASHPLAGDADQVRSAAVLMLLERDRANIGELRRAYESIMDTRRFVGLLGEKWDPVTTSHGIWGVRPGQDGVVMLGPGYVFADASDDDAVLALLRVGSMLPFSDPVLGTRSALSTKARSLIADVGMPLKMSRRPEVARRSER